MLNGGGLLDELTIGQPCRDGVTRGCTGPKDRAANGPLNYTAVSLAVFLVSVPQEVGSPVPSVSSPFPDFSGTVIAFFDHVLGGINRVVSGNFQITF